VDNLLQYLASLSAEPCDCIVHLGAGADASADDYTVLRPKQLVLIEADPEAHTALAERFKDASGVTVIQALVGLATGVATFHRYTLPSLNAPLGLGRLRELYPRIEEIETISLQSSLLHEIWDEKSLGARNLLILDVPGQEAAILRSMPPDFLDRFSDLLAVTAAQIWQEGAETAQTTLAALKEHDFELERESGDDPAWPHFLLRHDSAKAALKQELEHRARLLVTKATQIHQQSEQIAALTTERDDLSVRLAVRDAELADLVTRHTSQVTESEALRSDHSSLSTLHSSLVAERDALAARVSSLESEKSSLSTLHSSLVAERDALVTENAALRSEHSSLFTLHSSLVAERDALVTEREALHSDLSAKSTLLDVLTKGRIAQDEQLEKLLLEQDGLIAARDDLTSRVAELASQIAKLEAHAETIDEEFGKAEGQIALIKDIFLREAPR